MDSNNNTELSRSLGFRDSSALVVGTILGTGVFLKAAIMTQYVGTASWVLWAWAAAGLLSLAGALAYAELGVLFPKAGGEYVYLKEGYGNFLAFMYGWMRFWIGAPGSIAAYAVGSATFASKLTDLSPVGGITGLAILFIVLFSVLNTFSVKFGGGLQSFMTFLKLNMVAFLIYGAFFMVDTSPTEASVIDGSFPGWSAFGAAMIAALWAYDGWNNLPMVAGEIKDPAKNIPRALGFGMLAILIIYGLLNLSYFNALGTEGVLTSSSKLYPEAPAVAAKTAMAFLGDSGVWFFSLALVLSAVGAMNGSILTGARVPYALAKDRLFLPALAYVNPKTHTPTRAVIVQAAWACILALWGNFDQLTDYVVFASWIFYVLVTFSLFIFRKKYPNRERQYQAWGYPYVPVLFMIAATLLLINTLITSTKESLFGLFLLSLGLPVYFYMVFKKGKSSNEAKSKS